MALDGRRLRERVRAGGDDRRLGVVVVTPRFGDAWSSFGLRGDVDLRRLGELLSLRFAQRYNPPDSPRAPLLRAHSAARGTLSSVPGSRYRAIRGDGDRRGFGVRLFSDLPGACRRRTLAGVGLRLAGLRAGDDSFRGRVGIAGAGGQLLLLGDGEESSQVVERRRSPVALAAVDQLFKLEPQSTSTHEALDLLDLLCWRWKVAPDCHQYFSFRFFRGRGPRPRLGGVKGLPPGTRNGIEGALPTPIPPPSFARALSRAWERVAATWRSPNVPVIPLAPPLPTTSVIQSSPKAFFKVWRS